MRKYKYLALRTLAITLQIVHFLAIVAVGAYLAATALGFLSSNLSNIFDGTFKLKPGDTSTIIWLVVAAVGFIVLLCLTKPVARLRSYINSFIDDFEDTAAYSRKKNLKVGERDEYGNMVTGLKLKRGGANPMQDLDKLIGLKEVKDEIRKMQAVFEYEKKNKANAGKQFCRHYAFLGSPGTGKTSVSRIFAGLLYQSKQIKRNVYVECTGNDLTGEFLGQTKTKVDGIYNMAKGGVIFIDEAYALGEGSDRNSLANEAISQLLVHMESDPYTVIIFAGYTEPMQRFFNINPGLTSRVAKQIEFPNYNADELLLIFKKFAREKQMQIENTAEFTLHRLFTMKLQLVAALNANFSNGRYVRNCFNEIYQQHALNEIERRSSNAGRLSNVIVSADITPIEDVLLQLE